MSARDPLFVDPFSRRRVAVPALLSRSVRCRFVQVIGAAALVTAFGLIVPAFAQQPVLSQPVPSAKPGEDGKPVERLPLVSVVQVARKELVDSVTVTGTLIARDEIAIVPEVEGLPVVEILVDAGDRVEAGQVLVRLSKDTIATLLAQNSASIARGQAAIAQAQSQIVQSEAADVEARQALDRAKLLLKSGNTTDAILEQRVSAARSSEGRLSAARQGLVLARADLTQIQAQRAELDLRMARTQIRAPVAGLVLSKTARVGAVASASGDPLFRLAANGIIELDAEIPDHRMALLREGAPVEVTLAGRVVAGKVRNVIPEIDRNTRLGRIRVTLTGDTTQLVGAFARARVEIARSTGLTVPHSAIVESATGARVLAVSDGVVSVRAVRLGLRTSADAQIVEGLKDGEIVVAKAGSFLRDGDRVRVAVDSGPAQQKVAN